MLLLAPQPKRCYFRIVTSSHGAGDPEQEGRRVDQPIGHDRHDQSEPELASCASRENGETTELAGSTSPGSGERMERQPESQPAEPVTRDGEVAPIRSGGEVVVDALMPLTQLESERSFDPSLTPADLGLEARESTEPPGPMARGRDMRSKLLARAAAFEAGSSPAESGLDEFEEYSEHAVEQPRDRELNLIGSAAPRPPAAIARRGTPAALSANMVALFGTILGLATIATIVALLISLAPEPQAIKWAPSLHPSRAISTQASSEAAASAAPSKIPAPVAKRQRTRLPGPWRVRDAKGDAAVRIVDGKIGREPFLRAIQDAGLPKKEAYRALVALKGLRNLEDCNRTDEFKAALERSSKRLKAFEYIVSAEEVYQAKEGADGLLKGEKLDLKVERGRVEGAFVFLGGNVDDSAERAGLERGLASALGNALEGHLSLSELESGDRIRFIGQEVTVLGEFARYAGMEVVQIRHADPKEKMLTVYYFRGSKSRGHYDQDGKAPFEGGWRVPVKGAPVTSKFNMKRLHPVLKKIMPHTGTDFGAPMGAIVGASSPGTIAFIGYAGASGNLVKVEHSGGYETGYAHLSRFAEGLKVGDKVKRMQLVGYVGSTGRSTGPHLHFTAKKDGKFIDAESLNLDGMRVLPSSERGEFDSARQKYDQALAKVPWPDLPPGLVAAAERKPSQDTVTEMMDDPMVAGGEQMGEPPSGDEDDLGMGSASTSEVGADTSASTGSKVYLTDDELKQLAPQGEY